MERTPVTSSDILSVGYDPDQEILEIEFIRGAVYQYSGVPIAVYEGLMSADSKGKFFHVNIKNTYAFVKL